jgi:hypothetical protein
MIGWRVLIRLLAGCLLPLFITAGCKLIDQTTFAPSPSQNPALLPAPPPPPPIDKRAPLITINQGTPIPAYRDLLRVAIEQARRRDPNVRFDVTVVVPNSSDPAAQAAAVASTQKEAVALMQQIGLDGVAPTNISLRAGVDASATQRQIRVYVR